MTTLPLDHLLPHPHNPRGSVDPASIQELADSIREHGILEPLLIVPHPEQKDRYVVVAGHRRLAAAEAAGLQVVPVIVRTDLDSAKQEEVMLVENLQREDLTPLQEARAFERLIRQGYTRADIIRNTGIGQARLQATLQILRLGQAAQEMFGCNQLPITAVAHLAKVENLDQQARLAAMVAERRLPVQKLEQIVGKMLDGTEDGKQKIKKMPKTVPSSNQPAKRYGRADAIADLTERADRQLSHQQLLDALNDVCHSCGMDGYPNICQACPLPQFFNNLMRETKANAATAA